MQKERNMNSQPKRLAVITGTSSVPGAIYADRPAKRCSRILSRAKLEDRYAIVRKVG